MILYVGYNLKKISNENSQQIIDTYKISYHKNNNFDYIIRLNISNNNIIVIFEKGFDYEKELILSKTYKNTEVEVLLSMTNCPFYYFLSKDFKKDKIYENKDYYPNLYFNITYDELLEMQNTIKYFRKYFSKFRYYKDTENKNLETIRESIRNNKLSLFSIFSQLFKLTRKIIIETNKIF